MSTLEVSNLNDGTTTVATTYVTNGSAKAWTTYNQSTNSLLDSFNISSQSDDATGRTTSSFATSFGNVNYSVAGCIFDGTGANDVRVIGHDMGTDTYTASALKVYTAQGDGALNDAERLFLNLHGDLA